MLKIGYRSICKIAQHRLNDFDIILNFCIESNSPKKIL